MLIYKTYIYYNHKERTEDNIFIDANYFKEFNTDLNLTDIITDYTRLNIHDIIDMDQIVMEIVDEIYKESFLDVLSYEYSESLKKRLLDDINSGEIVVSLSFEIFDEYSYIRKQRITKVVKSSGKDLREVIESDKCLGIEYVSISYDLNKDKIKRIIASYYDDRFGEDYYVMNQDDIKLYNSIKPGDVLAKGDGTLEAVVVHIHENKLGNMYNSCAIVVLYIEDIKDLYIDEYMICDGAYIHSHHPELLELINNDECDKLIEEINKIKGE